MSGRGLKLSGTMLLHPRDNVVAREEPVCAAAFRYEKAMSCGRPRLSIQRAYSVFTIDVPLAVCFATISIGTRKAESPEYGKFDRDLQ